jgi:AcrR family transcriptional regulator
MAAGPKTRVTKDPQVRREELLDIALELCRTQGFDAMRVDQIVQTAGVAKGTFYHYFPSKDAVGEALVQRFGDSLFDHLSSADAASTGDGVERLRTIMDAAAAFKGSQADLGYASFLYRDQNLMLRHRLFRRWRERAREVLLPVISDGITDGSFSVTNPDAVADVVLLFWFDAADNLWDRALGAPDADHFVEVLVAGSQAIFDSLERVLGVPEGTYAVPFSPELLELSRSIFHSLDRTQS